MTDEDSVLRFAQAVGVGNVTGPHQWSSKTKRKDVWRWGVWSFENTQAIIAMLWPWLGARRKAKATELLAVMRDRSAPVRDSKGRFESWHCAGHWAAYESSTPMEVEDAGP